ncbi:MAG: hypothetical protein Q8P20_07945 [bacterium]|nr:hypothetical protein [bacterium]
MQIYDSKKIDVLKNFNKLFNTKIPETSEADKKDIIPESELNGFMDPANVLMVIPKRFSIKATLLSLFDLGEGQKAPELSYYPDKDNEIVSKYSCEYLKIMLELTKHYEAITIKTRQDYPLWIECDDFIIILAPRVRN